MEIIEWNHLKHGMDDCMGLWEMEFHRMEPFTAWNGMPLFDCSVGAELHESERQVHGLASWLQLEFVAWYELVVTDHQAPWRLASAGAGTKRLPEHSLQGLRARNRVAEKQAGVAQGPAPAATIDSVNIDGGHHSAQMLAPRLCQRLPAGGRALDAAHDIADRIIRHAMAGGDTTQQLRPFLPFAKRCMVAGPRRGRGFGGSNQRR